jgi:citrate lyase subunit beta/citryl-CoA lyase
MRSMLFVPGDRPERFAKAAASGADAVILDLEDAVLPERRAFARIEISRWLVQGERRVPVWVRINPVETSDALPDLAAVIEARPDGIVLPKARDGDDVHRVDHWLEALEARFGLAPGHVGLLPLITESAGALLRAASFARLPARVKGLTWGAEDLAADIGALENRGADGEYQFTYALARSFCLLAAAAAGVPAYDTVDVEFRDAAAVERRARASRRQGFVGKLAIHPAQVGPIHAAFSPSADEVARAERVIAAFAAAPGVGAVAFEGGMLDRPHLRQAERILASRRRDSNGGPP